ncbi:MAG: hypothetical protein INH13_16910 [Cupriavidus sp.]|nr:hypothetical protein [Cupriavidus sp.]MCA3704342.1 hypothetical protein [Methylobacterium sp.]
MAQNAQTIARAGGSTIAKVETRLMPVRTTSHDVAMPQANAMLDPNGRVVPLAAVNLDASQSNTSCRSERRLRPAEIRKIAETEAERIGLPRDVVTAVIRAEGLLGAERPSAGAAILSTATNGPNCSGEVAAIQQGVAHLARMRQLYPAPVHYLAAYRDGEEAFLASGGVSDQPATLRFIVTALNELSTPISELAASPRAPGSQKATDRQSPAAPSVATARSPQSAHPDPRWVSGFVFNLE